MTPELVVQPLEVVPANGQAALGAGPVPVEAEYPTQAAEVGPVH